MDTCPICGQDGELRKCTGCESVSYCSSAHQKEHWKEHKENCSPLSIKEDSVFGKYWVATKDLSPGTLILTESPKLHCPRWLGSNWVCLVCGIDFEDDDRRLCSKCKWPICSENCEKHPIHAENECQIFTSQQTPFPPRLRNILLGVKKIHSKFEFEKATVISKCIQMIRGIGLKKNQPKVYKRLMKEDYGIADVHLKSSDIKSMIAVLKNLIDLEKVEGADETELYNFLIINGTNIFVWQDEINDKRAPINATFIKGPRASHSCSPNCSTILLPFPSLTHKIRTAVHIPKGQQVTINYMGYGFELSDRFQRLQDLKNGWNFDCHCDRCLDPTELGTFMDGVACTSCRQNADFDSSNVGYFLPKNPLDRDESTLWVCNSCGHSKMYSQIEDILEMQRLGLETAKLEMGHDDRKFVAAVEKCIVERSGKILHPNHYVLQFISKEIVNLLADMKLDRAEHLLLKEKIMYSLAIMDKIAPGINLVKASTLATFSTALLKASSMDNSGTIFTVPERIEMLKLAISSIEEASAYFIFDSTILAQHKSKLGLLKYLKSETQDTLKSIMAEA